MMVTTSRRPCVKSRKLCKELLGVIPSRYVLRGKKGIRELVHLSVEKGCDRMMVVTSKGEEPFSLQFYNEWNFLGELVVSVILRRELNIPKVAPLDEDIPFLMQVTGGAEKIKDLFGAEQYCHGHTYMVYNKGWIDFYRRDISKQLVGPRIQVKEVIYAGHN